MNRVPSFATRIFFTFTLGFLGLWFLFIAVGFNAYHANVEQLITGEVWWLRVYSQSLLGDLQVGNLHSIERKLNLLVQRGNLESVQFRYGSQRVQVTRPSNATEKYSMQGLLAALLLLEKHNTLSFDVKDTSQTLWGTIEARVDRLYLIKPVADSLMAFFCYSAAAFLLLLGGIYLYIEKQLRPLTRLTSYIASFSTAKEPSKDWGPLLARNLEFHTRELQTLHSEFNSAITNIIRLEEENKSQRIQGEISKVALQVAHDIRSPLSALDMVTASLGSLPEESRVLIRSAIGRIRDIANELLRNATPTKPEGHSDALDVEFITGLIDSIVSEKRVQWRKRLGVEINAKLDARSYGLFARVDATSFKRVLSNVIDNSAEAIIQSGVVSVEVWSSSMEIVIAVEDSGEGIGTDLMPKLMQPGVTFGKPKGKGLGLHYAKQEVSKWSGSLEIESEVNVGTTVRLRIPRVAAPAWFAPEIPLTGKARVIILDDDESIHGVWRQKFGKVAVPSIPLFHFSRADEATAWVENNSMQDALLLVDYELMGEQTTGLDFIRQLGLQKQSILVTSHYMEKSVLEECSRLNVRIIPKSVAAYVPIR